MSTLGKDSGEGGGNPRNPNKPAPQSFLQKCVSRLKKVLRVSFSSVPSKTEKQGKEGRGIG